MSLWDAVRRDPLDAPARTIAAGCILAGATLGYGGITGVLALGRGVSRWVAAGVVCAYTLTAALAAGELVTTLLDRSHSIGYSLAAKIWFQRHWRYNPYGYRDAAWTPEELKGRKVLAVIGDSLTTGHGIADPADTYCSLLGARLGTRYRTLNLGVNAADSVSELTRLKGLPLKPTAIVLEYFGNDIVEGARDGGLPPPLWAPYDSVPERLRALIARSYLANYLFFSMPRGDVNAFWSYVKGLYGKPAVLAHHADELRGFAAHAREIGVPLFVVVFPYLHDLEASDLYIPWVRELFASEGVPVLDVRPLIADMPLADRVVNMNDVHPSRAVHRRVADALYRMLAEHGLAR